MNRLFCMVLSALLLMLILPMTASAAVTFNHWSSSGPFKTGLGNRVITALAVSGDNKTLYSGTGSGSVFSYAYTPPTVTTGAASGLSATGATLNGTVNANNADATVSFEYGPDTNYGTIVAATPATVTGTSDSAVSKPLTGLSAGTTYHYRVNAVNSGGTSNGTDQTFTTWLAPAITSTNNASFTYGSAATFSVTTTGSPAPVLTRSGILPMGVSFHDNGNGSATIGGTPNASGTFPITITATNSSGSVNQSFSLTVNAAAGGSASLSALDSSISISPDRHLFGVVTLGSNGDTVPFTVTNHGSGPVTLGAAALGGANADQYQIASDGCSGSLVAGASCTVGVRFCPTTTGSKSAQLQVGHDGVTVTAFLHNHESVQEEASRRMPPVLSNLNIPTVMQKGQSYTITWSLLGYDDDYLSRIALFDCAGIGAGSCGASFGTNFADSGNLAAIATATGDWTYSGVTSKRFDYSYTFTAPASATDMVIRFYRKTVADDAAGKGSLSLLIPGNIIQSGTSYYDADGRRLLHAIAE